MSEDPRLPIAPGTTRQAAVTLVRRAFAAAGIDSPALDARLLLLAALGIGADELIARPDRPLDAGEAVRLRDFALRRLGREPVARILGEREFWGLPFRLSPATLVPRPDTETLVDIVLAWASDRDAPLRILDLGTGSGCLIVALLHELQRAEGLAVDRSPAALVTARENARRNGVANRASFVASDWAAAIRGAFDIIVSNPPYIATDALQSLDLDVRGYEPMAALDGGPDGLSAYRVILPEAGRLLAPGGLLAVEIGFDQEEALRGLAGASGWRVKRVAHDLAGHPRAVALQKIPS